MPSIVWKGHLTFGLISIPVKLFRAARRERIRLHYVHRPSVVDRLAEETLEESVPAKLHVDEETTSVDPTPVAPISRVRQTLVGAGDEQPINREEIFKGYGVEPDRYVVLDPQELRGLRRKTSRNMEIVRSVKLAEIDPVFFETSYYVEPDRAGEKPYAILFAALRETGRVALARVGMYGREHIVIVRAGAEGLLAHTIFYKDEIRFENEFRTDVQSVGAKELELAKTFLRAIEAPFAPEEFKDAYREELQALIAQKVGQTGLAPAQSAVAPAPVPDILEALKRSIAMARKAAGPDKRPARKEPGRVTEIKHKRNSKKA